MIESSEKSVADKLRACAGLSYGTVFSTMRTEFDTCVISDFCNKVADDIDAEEAEMRAFCERVEEAAKNRKDLDVFGTEYMALPLDRNGEPWHVDDLLDTGDGVYRVISVDKYGAMTTSEEHLGYVRRLAGTYSHYKKPTVEDVLRELIGEACGESSPDDETIAKYAAKLRLKEN